MKINILTSGFPNGLTAEFIYELKKYLPDNPTFLFIASDFSQIERTQYFLDVLLQSFKDKGLIFKSVNSIDYHISLAKSKELIDDADVIWLAGGPPLKQINDIRAYDLIPNLLKREGITIGMSAGSINMAKRAILIKDIDDNTKTEIYVGIGLVQVNIEPHLNYASIDHINNIKELSKSENIIGLYDNSFIVITDSTQEIFGKHIHFRK